MQTASARCDRWTSRKSKRCAALDVPKRACSEPSHTNLHCPKRRVDLCLFDYVLLIVGSKSKHDVLVVRESGCARGGREISNVFPGSMEERRNVLRDRERFHSHASMSREGDQTRSEPRGVVTKNNGGFGLKMGVDDQEAAQRHASSHCRNRNSTSDEESWSRSCGGAVTSPHLTTTSTTRTTPYCCGAPTLSSRPRCPASRSLMSSRSLCRVHSRDIWTIMQDHPSNQEYSACELVWPQTQAPAR